MSISWQMPPTFIAPTVWKVPAIAPKLSGECAEVVAGVVVVVPVLSAQLCTLGCLGPDTELHSLTPLSRM